MLLPTHKIPRPNDHNVEQPAKYCPMRCAKRSNWSNRLVKKLKTGCKTNVLVKKNARCSRQRNCTRVTCYDHCSWPCVPVPLCVLYLWSCCAAVSPAPVATSIRPVDFHIQICWSGQVGVGISPCNVVGPLVCPGLYALWEALGMNHSDCLRVELVAVIGDIYSRNGAEPPGAETQNYSPKTI